MLPLVKYSLDLQVKDSIFALVLHHNSPVALNKFSLPNLKATVIQRAQTSQCNWSHSLTSLWPIESSITTSH